MTKSIISYPKRVKFQKGKQKEFIEDMQKTLGFSIDKMAELVNIHPRSLRDWRREKITMPLSALEIFCQTASINKPSNIEILEPFWYSDLGGKAGWQVVFEKYGGVPKNEKKRKAGWQRWWLSKGQYNPGGYFVTRKVNHPGKSTALAELVGILLGDGGITANQVKITLHRYDDKEYIKYVAQTCENLFRVKPSVLDHRNTVVSNITISRVKLVQYLIKTGLRVGNKVKQQVTVPDWIQDNSQYSKRCLRGLFDTDGSFFIDRHTHKNKTYLNCGIAFTNRSLPLLKFFRENLEKLGFHPTQKTAFTVFLRREDEINKYFSSIGSSNPKHLNKFINFYKNKYGEVPKWS